MGDAPSLTTPGSSKLIKATKILHVISIIITIGVMIALIVNLVNGGNNFVSWVLSIYCLIFSIGILAVEIGRPVSLRETMFGRNWVARGLAYVFLGLVCTVLVNGQDNDATQTYGQAVGWILVALGVLYAILGVGCAKHLVEQRKERETEAASQRKMLDAVRAEQGQAGVTAAPRA